MARSAGKSVVRNSKMSRDSSLDILDVIEEHHKELKDFIEVLTSLTASEAQKRKHLERFIPWFRMHTYAEQETLYDAIRGIEGLKHYALEGYEEHEIADGLIIQLETLGYSDKQNWNDEMDTKAKIMAELVAQHLDEEESELFPAIKKYMTSIELVSLRDEYKTRCEQYLQRNPVVPYVSSFLKETASRVTRFASRLT